MLNLIKAFLVKALIFLFTHRADVIAVVTEIAKLDVRGERKRSLALNRLREQFPDIPAKDLALMIELVLQEK